jgi:hypothetical protein
MADTGDRLASRTRQADMTERKKRNWKGETGG